MSLRFACGSRPCDMLLYRFQQKIIANCSWCMFLSSSVGVGPQRIVLAVVVVDRENKSDHHLERDAESLLYSEDSESLLDEHESNICRRGFNFI